MSPLLREKVRVRAGCTPPRSALRKLAANRPHRFFLRPHPLLRLAWAHALAPENGGQRRPSPSTAADRFILPSAARRAGALSEHSREHARKVNISFRVSCVARYPIRVVRGFPATSCHSLPFPLVPTLETLKWPRLALSGRRGLARAAFILHCFRLHPSVLHCLGRAAWPIAVRSPNELRPPLPPSCSRPGERRPVVAFRFPYHDILWLEKSLTCR